jgi:hypothetical protein
VVKLLLLLLLLLFLGEALLDSTASQRILATLWHGSDATSFLDGLGIYTRLGQLLTNVIVLI